MDPKVPLVIPEINARRIREHEGIIAVPNCSAITALVPLWPIHLQNRIKRLILSTYQAASGAGAAAMEELVSARATAVEGCRSWKTLRNRGFFQTIGLCMGAGVG